MMKSFRDPATGVLKAFGYCDENAPGDLAREEPDDFHLEPGKWQFVDGEWVPRAPSIEEQAGANTAAIQAELERQAQAKGYDSILSACSYAAQPEGAPFQAEGAAFLAWRSAAWQHAYDVLQQVQAGTAPMPTPAEAVAAMPALTLS